MKSPTLIWIMFLRYTVVLSYDNSSSALNAFPSNIPASETVVILNSNSIPNVSAANLQPLTSLLNLSIDNNQLTEFPDLRPVRKTIQAISLANNLISTVNREYFTGVSNLAYVDLQWNLLTIFPDFGDSVPSIQILDLSNNPSVITVPRTNVLGFRSLLQINMGFSTYDGIRMPNFCLNRNVSWIFRPNLILTCDCLSRYWYHVAEILVDVDGYLLCSSNYEDLKRFSFDKLLCGDYPEPTSQGRKGFMGTSVIESGFYCRFPPVANILEVSGPVDCLFECANTKGCMDFNLSPSASGKYICHVTSTYSELAMSPQPAVAYTDEASWNYYSLL